MHKRLSFFKRKSMCKLVCCVCVGVRICHSVHAEKGTYMHVCCVSLCVHMPVFIQKKVHACMCAVFLCVCAYATACMQKKAHACMCPVFLCVCICGGQRTTLKNWFFPSIGFYVLCGFHGSNSGSGLVVGSVTILSAPENLFPHLQQSHDKMGKGDS